MDQSLSRRQMGLFLLSAFVWPLDVPSLRDASRKKKKIEEVCSFCPRSYQFRKKKKKKREENKNYKTASFSFSFFRMDRWMVIWMDGRVGPPKCRHFHPPPLTPPPTRKVSAIEQSIFIALYFGRRNWLKRWRIWACHATQSHHTFLPLTNSTIIIIYILFTYRKATSSSSTTTTNNKGGRHFQMHGLVLLALVIPLFKQNRKLCYIRAA